jgi:hypothetical protein
MKALAADPEPTARAIAGPGDEAVHGDGDPCKHLAHWLSLSSQAAGGGVINQTDGWHEPKSSLGRLNISMD